MKIKPLASVLPGQDGAIFGHYLIRFNEKGDGAVYDLENLTDDLPNDASFPPLCRLTLDGAERLAPHSNAVVFGKEYYAKEDEFPLLYSNIYNNYAATDTPLKGVCCVYRLQREGRAFKTTLVQIIEIDFVEDASLWRASVEADGPRPYGNFVVDTDKGLYYAFVMRNEALGTRYFAFDLPKVTDGAWDATYRVRRVSLRAEDVKNSFDLAFHRYVQGACYHGGKIYSTEGFGYSSDKPPALRIIDTATGREECYQPFADFGLAEEPEMIDFYGERCLYSDGHGRLYEIFL